MLTFILNYLDEYVFFYSQNSIEEDISLEDSLPFFTTPISLLPFHVVFNIGLDGGYFYQLVCFLRLFSLYQDGRIQISWGDKNTTLQQTGILWYTEILW